jgi:DNA repair exonuclease SbcCD nuclease subunit
MIHDTKADVCMGHLEINGFQMNKNVFVSQGGREKEFFRKFDTVMSGHFHHKSDDGQIYYLGTPYELYWNDWEDKKGFHIYDTETRELERIVNPYTIHEKIYYDDTKENYLEHDITKYANKYVKLIVVVKKDLYQFDQFLDKLYEADAFDIKIVEDFSDLDASSVSDDIVENTEDTVTLLNKYIDDLPIDLSKDRLKNQMKSLYTEAQDLDLE